MALPELAFTYKKFLDKTTIVYGETGTGKSTIILDILYNLCPHVDQIYVISPMDRQNHTYDQGVVPLPMISYNITADLLNDIWERQSAFAAVYTRANNAEILRALFDRVTHDRKSRGVLASLKKRKELLSDKISQDATDPAVAQDRITTMSKEYDKMVAATYRKCISDNYDYLMRLNLSDEERYTMKFLDFNPKLVLVLDDCTDLLTKFKAHPVVQKLFYQGRWAFVTAIIACHTDKAFTPETKKNAFVSIFTEESCALAYFNRGTTDLGKEAKARATAACKQAFTPMLPYQKLAWVREEKKFYRFVATKHEPFCFGSDCFIEYCERIAIEKGAMPANNKFVGDFI